MAHTTPNPTAGNRSSGVVAGAQMGANPRVAASAAPQGCVHFRCGREQDARRGPRGVPRGHRTAARARDCAPRSSSRRCLPRSGSRRTPSRSARTSPPTTRSSRPDGSSFCYDPAGQDAWEGSFRAVTFVRAALESELGRRPDARPGRVDLAPGVPRLGRCHVRRGRRHGHPGRLGELRRAAGPTGDGRDRGPGVVDPAGRRRPAPSRRGRSCCAPSRACRRCRAASQRCPAAAEVPGAGAPSPAGDISSRVAPLPIDRVSKLITLALRATGRRSA